MKDSVGWQLFSFLGAILILVAYAAHQMKWMDSRKPLYNILNAIGSAILAYMSFFPFRLGFAVMEIVWVGISIFAIVRSARERQADVVSQT